MRTSVRVTNSPLPEPEWSWTYRHPVAVRCLAADADGGKVSLGDDRGEVFDLTAPNREERLHAKSAFTPVSKAPIHFLGRVDDEVVALRRTDEVACQGGGGIVIGTRGGEIKVRKAGCEAFLTVFDFPEPVVAVTGGGGLLLVVAVDSGDLFTLDLATDPPAARLLNGTQGWVVSLGSVGQTNLVAAGGAVAGSVRVAVVGPNPQWLTARLHSDLVVGLAWLPGGRLVSAGLDGEVKLWRPFYDPHGQWVRRVARHEACVTALAPLSDGRGVVSAAGREVRWWRPQGGCFREPQADGPPARTSVAVRSPDGARVAEGHADGRVVVSPETGWKEIPRHRAQVTALAWLGEDCLISAALDGSVRFSGPRLPEPLTYYTADPVVRLAAGLDGRDVLATRECDAGGEPLRLRLEGGEGGPATRHTEKRKESKWSEVITRMKQGDREAAGELAERLAPRYRAHYLSRNESEAECLAVNSLREDAMAALRGELEFSDDEQSSNLLTLRIG